MGGPFFPFTCRRAKRGVYLFTNANKPNKQQDKNCHINLAKENHEPLKLIANLSVIQVIAS